MLRRLKLLVAPLLGILFVFLASLAIVHTSETFDHCIERAQYKGAQDTLGKKPSDVPVSIRMRQNCWGHFVEKNADGIIALFTIVLAGSTIGLWFSTRAAAKTARAAAEYISRVERAYVHGGFGPQRGGRRVHHGGEMFTVAVTLANYGKTPAHVMFVEVGSAKLSELPAEPNFDFAVPISDYYFPLMTMGEVRRTAADITVPAHQDWVVFGRVHYRDVLGNRRFSSWAFEFTSVMTASGWHLAEKLIALNTPYWATSDTPESA